MTKSAKVSRLTERGATLLQEIGVLPAGLSGQDLRGFLRQYSVKCPKEGCRKEIKSVVQVRRVGKYKQVYEYLRLRHNDGHKRDGRSYCYIKISETHPA